MIKHIFKTIFIVIPLLIIVGSYSPVTAQSEFGFGLAHTFPIDEAVSPGDIIVIKDTEYLKSTTPYDTNIVGVVVDVPAVVFTYAEDTGIPMITKGLADVKVSSSNGDILKGDYLTTSTLPGIAMKATATGFVIGVADADYSAGDPEEIGLIPVNLHFTFIELGAGGTVLKGNYQRSLADIFSLNRLAATESPAQVLKYTVAALLLISSFGFGFYIFGKTANKGIEAMGRNPLAGNLIGFSVALNVVITIIIIFAGVGLSYLIIIL